ncbi:19831_t:CDS:2 [Funneliformis geosporum]|uniref:19831_t:CDS:1 n=1 Tax=Funneliformis geosporum TaxID=1117311 RepID=A0A9W4SM18_9GLOM|nr:19831_t:CDS:2 [Funneliformis geosporum]
MALIKQIRVQAGCASFPQQAPSNLNEIPDVSRCYEISVPKKGQLEVDEHYLFNY